MTTSPSSFSWSRLAALCRKEGYQIIRDPGSIMISFVFPLILLVIFGYGINFDSGALRVGLVLEDHSPEARRFADVFKASPFIDARVSDTREDLAALMQAGKLRGIVVVPVNFARGLSAGSGLASTSVPSSTLTPALTPVQAAAAAPIQVITDGSEPNTANFVHGYVTGVWQTWQEQRAQDAGLQTAPMFDMQMRYWFNQAAVSRNFIVPGAVTIIMTVLGAILTSLVIAREWERGTMEALLSTQITKAELLLSKLIPYYCLGMMALTVCMAVSILIFEVPFRGSFFVLWVMSTLFLANTLGMGLLISTLTRNQFNAAQLALNVAFLPATMLSGFVFEIDSMPAIIRGISYLVPAKYYVNVMHTLFLAGNIPFILLINGLCLLVTGALLLGLTTIKTRLRLE